MRPRSLLSVVVAAGCAAACLVPTFDVGPIDNASGGTTAGDATNGGKTAGGTTSESGGKTGGGGASSAGGRTDAAGDTMTGEAGAGMPSNPGNGITRVGYSEFHDSASGSDNASAMLTDATFMKPAATAPGDFMLVFFGADHSLQNLGSSHLALTGWTLHAQHHDYGVDGQATYLVYKIAGDSEPASIVFDGINSASSPDGVQGLLSVYRGVSPTQPINAYEAVIDSLGSKTTTHVESLTPAITTTVDNCLLIAGLSPDSAVDAPVIEAWPAGFGQNRVSVTNPPNPFPNGWANIYAAERPLPKAGYVAGSSFGWVMTYGGMEYYGALAFVLALAPPP